MAFGRLERTTGPQPMSDINMTPLIDVMLVLLVIFIITAPLLTHAVKMDLPKAASAPPGKVSRRCRRRASSPSTR
jgi:biopolymer transport protein TolR